MYISAIKKVLPLLSMDKDAEICDNVSGSSGDAMRGKTIADMSPCDRPREKALVHGFDALSDAELLAILFNTGIRNMNVVELSKAVLDDNDGHLSRLVRMRPGDIVRRYKGIGTAKAVTLLAALQLGIRAAKDGITIRNKHIKSSIDIYELMAPRLQWLNHEEFWVLYLSRANEVICEQLIGKGGIDATVVDVRVVMREALQLSVSSMAFVHNHPSGSLEPSVQDRALTKKLSAAAAIFDIRVIDHVIIGAQRGYFSFCDRGLI